jgi:hypothetical protein
MQPNNVGRNNDGGLRRTGGEWVVEKDEAEVGKEKNNQVQRVYLFNV